MDPANFLLTAAEMREMDRVSIEEYGVPGLVLMENAGRGAAAAALELFPLRRGTERVAVVCGPGNNGGDGYVAARHLANRGLDVRVLLVADRARITGDADVQLRILERMHAAIVPAARPGALLEPERESGLDLLRADLVVDALLGTGLAQEVRSPYREAIAAINAAAARVPVLALDLPSGIDSDTGAVRGVAVRATATATFAFPKRGLYLYPGRAHAGTVRVVDIGMPLEVARVRGATAGLLDAALARAGIPPRPPDAHKGTYGHLLVWGGSPGKVGAAVLAARAALRTGVGLCTVAAPESSATALHAAAAEAMFEALGPLGGDGDGGGRGGGGDGGGGGGGSGASESDGGSSSVRSDPGSPSDAGAAAPTDAGATGAGALAARLLALASARSAVAAGPGLGQSAAAAAALAHLVAHSPVPLVLDADALNLVAAAGPRLLDGARAPVVLTPHPGEMARLTGLSTATIQADRVAAAQSFAGAHRVHVVLKGASTVVAHPDGTVWVCPAGNPGMATGGAGDVLTGVIGALLAARVEPGVAARTGVYLHAAAGDRAAAHRGLAALCAGDLPDAIAEVLLDWKC
ncbi:MAG TPA: NAD(P)H-hydrate dehydratase [Myxococcota bacterium]|jgi:NAD(P)H-hydrate epimerase|nr:NAD(P)H-hydrate dehydratase [Myxococcota bacterium]